MRNLNTLPKMSKQKQDRPRHSLQPQPHQPIHGPLRQTKSQNYDRRHSVGGARKKITTSTISTIHEVEGESTISGSSDVVEVVNEKKKEKKRSGSGGKKKTSGYDNVAFEGSTGSLTIDRHQGQFQRNSVQGSFISTSSSVKNPSIRSLP